MFTYDSTLARVLVEDRRKALIEASEHRHRRHLARRRQRQRSAL